MKAAIFDLDMTLVDSSYLEQYRKNQLWQKVKREIDRVRPFDLKQPIAPHKIPAAMKKQGLAVAVVTSSPGWYAKQILSRFHIPFDVLIAYEDTEQHKPDAEPLELALKRLAVDASETFYLGDDIMDVEACHHAGITCIGAAWRYAANGPPLKTFCSCAPSIVLWTPSSLLKLNKLPNYELLGERLTKDDEAIWHRGSTLSWRENGQTVQALGRYIKADDSRQANHELSKNIIDLKNDDDGAEGFGELLARYVNASVYKPQAIVSVPPKPDQRNRFSSLLDYTQDHINGSVSVHNNSLSCTRAIDGYKEMGEQQRRRAIRGVFKTKRQWHGKVLLIDDVYTTGAVSDECVRVLIANGAEEVRVLVFGLSQQRLESMSCPNCERRMRIRKNSNTGERFWGCSGFPDHCQRTVSIAN